MTRPEISCVIPAYEHPEMVARCLTSVAGQTDVRLEIIVSDDSATARVRDLAAALGGILPPIRFVEGPRSGNPVDNWNAGLALARAPLCLLVHQDEFLVDPLYLRRGVDALRPAGVAAARAGVAVIGVSRPSRFALASALVGALPGAVGLLPAINWIGPTAAFIFRAGHRFDPALVQLADVEFYRRVLKTGTLVRLPGIGVGSLGHHGAQITARIDPGALARRELAMLAARSPPGITRAAHALGRLALLMRSGRG